MSRLGRLLLLLFSLSALGCAQSSNDLGPVGVATTASGDVRQGQLLHVGFSFEAARSKAVHLLRARLERVPKLVEVVAIQAVAIADLGTTIGVLRGDLRSKYPGTVFHPLTDVTLVPDQQQKWQVVVTLRSQIAGEYRIPRIRVIYKTDEERSQSFPFAIKMNVLLCQSPEDMKSSVCGPSRGEINPTSRPPSSS